MSRIKPWAQAKQDELAKQFEQLPILQGIYVHIPFAKINPC
jgi:hypothetical protein